MHQQSAIVEFLLNPSTYGPGCAAVEKVETHCALVFLAGDYAYKIKKPVKFDYLDFSSLEQRKAALQLELELNRPHAPGIYLDVMPVRRLPDGTLSFEAGAEIVEWVLRMRRFLPSALLRNRAVAGELNDELIFQLANVVADYHQLAPAAYRRGFAKHIEELIEQLACALSRSQPTLSTDAAQVFSTQARGQFEQIAACISRREKAGFVRRCHGDLHLSNIVVLNAVPTLFDALEFNEDLATIDVLYDLAFLLMDLDHHGLALVANKVLNQYLRRTDPFLENTGLRCLPLFMACRAGIRSRVSLDLAGQKCGTEAAEQYELANSYLQRAVGYLATRGPVLVAVGGYSGTGKSTLAREVAPALFPKPGAIHIRTDIERKLMAGVGETDRLPPSTYTPESGALVYRSALDKASKILREQWSVIVDATFLNENERRAVEHVALEAGADFFGFWLEAEKPTLVKRVSARRGDASDATCEVVRGQLRQPTGPISWQRIYAGRALDAVVLDVLSHLRSAKHADLSDPI